MKKALMGILFLTTMSSFASDISTCEDPNDVRNENNFMVIRETSAGKSKLLSLTLKGKEYLPDGSVYCEKASGPIGGVRGGKEIMCDLPGGLKASVHYVSRGAGSVSVFNGNKVVANFKKFNCY